jgi:DNA-binding NarL/FixJ family response regulator
MSDNTRILKVILADDHKLVRSGFGLMLRSLGNVEVVAETGDGTEALQLILQHRPDIALLDISMPGLTGIEIARLVRDQCPEVRIIILSMHVSEEFIARAIRAGVSGYLLKSADPEELELAVQAALKGGLYLSSKIPPGRVDDYLQRLGPDEDILDHLTPRQREVLQLLAEGKNNKVIADVLNVSVKTVETHRAKLMDRLGVHDIAGLVRFAIRTGIIEAN